MEQYHVTGMSCAACQARVEKAVEKVPGVDSCAVSLLTNSMGVEGSADAAAIIKAVEEAGYGASVKSGDAKESSRMPDYESELQDTETPGIRKRLIASLILLIPLLYVSMGHTMWGWRVPGFLDHNPVAVGIWQMLLAGLVMVINQKFFIRGFRGLLQGATNMDTLVALGSGASFLWSVYVLFALSRAQMEGDLTAAEHLSHQFYFESAAMILALITVGKLLESISKGRTTDALKNLMKLAAKTAVVIRDGKETEVPIEQVQIGDRFVVRPGDNIPVDGVVVEGASAVNESALTGESIPVDKSVGDPVSAATGNESGFMICEATRVGEDTTLSQIIQMVSDAAATKAPIAKIADRVSGIFVPAVIGIAAGTFLIWMLVGQTVGYALARAISVLVISCPCALGLATPVAIMVGNGVGAKRGIMFKTAVSLEETGKVPIVVLDKTGTITKGQPKVIEIKDDSKNDNHTADLMTIAYSLESRSEHPLAKAVVEKAQELGLEKKDVSDFQAYAGNGLSGVIDGKRIRGGNLEFVSEYVKPEEAVVQQGEAMADKGQTPLFFAEETRLLGIISVADVIREDSPQAIEELKKMGCHVVMLTGDNARTAAAIAGEAGVDEVVSDVKPDEKEAVIRRLQEYGKVAMVGDGINDAPALTRADTGIAIGAGNDVAIDAADVVLMKSRIRDVAAAIRLSRATLRNIHQNLFWAFFYNVIGIPLAAGAYIHAFGWELHPMFGAAAMSLSSFCVVTNALRLNYFRIDRSDRDKIVKKSLGHQPLLRQEDPKDLDIKRKETGKEDNNMEIQVKGMMCEHCEMHVKKALEALDHVTEAAADHKTGTVTVKTTGEVSAEAMKAAIEDAGYEYVG